MKKILITFTLFLSACATRQPPIDMTGMTFDQRMRVMEFQQRQRQQRIQAMQQMSSALDEASNTWAAPQAQGAQRPQRSVTCMNIGNGISRCTEN